MHVLSIKHLDPSEPYPLTVGPETTRARRLVEGAGLGEGDRGGVESSAEGSVPGGGGGRLGGRGRLGDPEGAVVDVRLAEHVGRADLDQMRAGR